MNPDPGSAHDRMNPSQPSRGVVLDTLADFVDTVVAVLDHVPRRGEPSLLESARIRLPPSAFLILTTTTGALAAVGVEAIQNRESVADAARSVPSLSVYVLITMAQGVLVTLLLALAALILKLPLDRRRAFELMCYSTAFVVVGWMFTGLWVLLLMSIGGFGSGFPLEAAPLWAAALYATAWLTACVVKEQGLPVKKFVSIFIGLLLFTNVLAVSPLLLARSGIGGAAQLNGDRTLSPLMSTARGAASLERSPWSDSITVYDGDIVGLKVSVYNTATVPAHNIRLIHLASAFGDGHVVRLASLVTCENCDRTVGGMARLVHASKSRFRLVLISSSAATFQGQREMWPDVPLRLPEGDPLSDQVWTIDKLRSGEQGGMTFLLDLRVVPIPVQEDRSSP